MVRFRGTLRITFFPLLLAYKALPSKNGGRSDNLKFSSFNDESVRWSEIFCKSLLANEIWHLIYWHISVIYLDEMQT